MIERLAQLQVTNSSARAKELFDEHIEDVHCRRDQVFAGLMAAQWAFGIALALIYSPSGWSGKVQFTHLHVYYALFVGGAISGPTILLTLRRPPVCQRRVRQLPLDISVPKGGEWIPERAQAIRSFWS